MTDGQPGGQPGNRGGHGACVGLSSPWGKALKSAMGPTSPMGKLSFRAPGIK